MPLPLGTNPWWPPKECPICQKPLWNNHVADADWFIPLEGYEFAEIGPFTLYHPLPKTCQDRFKESVQLYGLGFRLKENND